jgi:hypothetical protein
VVGFDFCFGAPSWFVLDQGCRTIGDFWQLAARDGETWLGPPPTLPFWRDAGMQPPPERRFRRCEHDLKQRGYPPAMIFMLVGPKTVGTGSVRGMPFLTRLRAAGFAIWPFDPPSDRTIVEIYPSCLRHLAAPSLQARDYTSNDERDAVLSAAVMWEHRESFAQLQAASDPVTLLEGDVWTPPAFWTA